jgi:hypothetical protein
MALGTATLEPQDIADLRVLREILLELQYLAALRAVLRQQV